MVNAFRLSYGEKSMTDFYCDLEQTGVPFEHFWEHTVGSGHAPLALRADWQAQLQKCHEEVGFRHVRFHGLLSGAMQTLFMHQEELVYSFFNVDRIFDFLLSIGMRPFVELSFMPEVLASENKTVFNYVNFVSPPKDYSQWSTLISKLVSHCVERYGVDEVRQWYFEVWNEPNLDAFWTGSREDYFKLYRTTVDAIKEVDPDIRVGGPATARNEWLTEFLEFCRQNDLPADFISTHHYPTDAFGSPGDDTETQLAKGERSILQVQVQDAKRKVQDKPLFYTEWNSSSNPRDPLHDQPYAAAFVTKTIMEAHDLLEGYSFWTFTDIFEENYFPSAPFHGGFGLLNIYGIGKPVYRAYEILHQLGDEQLLVDGLHNTLDVWVVRDGRLPQDALTVLLTNHALPHHAINGEKVAVHLAQARPPQGVRVARIDAEHANPRYAWEQMGRPRYLSEAQVAQLEQASCLTWEPATYRYEEEVLHLELEMPPHAVAAVAISNENNEGGQA